MRRILIATTLAIAASCAAYAQDPAPKPDANAEHPPTNRMDEATPTMKAPSGAEHAPTNRVDQAVPPMKPTDPQSADTGTKAGTSADTGTKTSTFVASEEWIGRSVYSSDGKELGKVDSLKKEGDQSQLYVDIGGFLGIGTTRALISSDQIQEVQDDRIVLRLTEAEAKNLPAADDNKPAAQ
jgi:sporulation protein YlmC with PRC-barrel domain